MYLKKTQFIWRLFLLLFCSFHKKNLKQMPIFKLKFLVRYAMWTFLYEKSLFLHLCLLTFTSPISSMLVLVRLRVVMKYGLFHKPKNDVSKSKQQSSPFFPFDFSVIINYKRSSGNTGIGGTTLRGDTIFDAFLFYLLSILSSHHVCCCHCCLNSYWKKVKVSEEKRENSEKE